MALHEAAPATGVVMDGRSAVRMNLPGLKVTMAFAATRSGRSTAGGVGVGHGEAVAQRQQFLLACRPRAEVTPAAGVVLHGRFPASSGIRLPRLSRSSTMTLVV